MVGDIDQDPTYCPTCRNLDYHSFDPSDGYGLNDRDNPLTRYLKVEFRELRESAQNGCSDCDIVNRGTRLFWGNRPEYSRESGGEESEGEESEGEESEGEESEGEGSEDRDEDELNHLCLERLPGRSLTGFRFEHQPLVSEYNMRIEFFTEHGAVPSHPAFANANIVKHNLTINDAVASVNTWLETCEQTHPFCQSFPARLPARMLSVSGELPKLIETNGNLDGTYITLSHCWGQDPNIRPTLTTLDNIESRKNGIPPQQLCALFKDLVDFARLLGCEFVWIDSLCIIQNDRDDWIRESSKMADIYSNSFLNVAATSLPDSSCSLFAERKTFGFTDHPSNPLDTYKLKYSVGTPEVSVRVSHRPDHEFLCSGARNRRWREAPLLERAWVLQERLLARRSIHFCRSELIWECRSSYACECMGTGLESVHQQGQDLDLSSNDMRPSFGSSNKSTTVKQGFSEVYHQNLSPQQANDVWFKVVNEYSGLQLSEPLDRYYAFAGIARIFHKTVNDRYLAGIWETDMPRGLCWFGLPRSSLDYSRSAMAPTWSWMSRISEFSYGQYASNTSYPLLADNFVRDTRLAIEHISSKPYPSFGPCEKIRLDIVAAALSARITAHYDAIMGRSEYYISLQLPVQIREPWTKKNFTLKADCPGPSGDDLKDRDECFCLLQGKVSTSHQIALVVRKSLSGEEGTFTRIGIVQLECHGWDYFQNAEITVFSLI